ncbi:MAG: 16S rRNA (cytosine(1402)-N(4))-methyltransferase RsmH [Gammaproteobacteria bacterium]
MEQHVPVLRDQVLEQLVRRPDGIYLDCTFGRGGHSRAILSRLAKGGRLYALDRDPQAVAVGIELAAEDERFVIGHAPFSDFGAYLDAQGVDCLDGLLLDLGVSSPQLDDADRGFSFVREGPLDMRMDPGTGLSAAQWLNAAEEREIAQVLRRLGEEKAAGRIARAIGQRRKETAINTTGELAALIEAEVPRRPGAKHPATRSFQAIRMHINRELDELDAALAQTSDRLCRGGRLCVISFHSLEDRCVKRFMRDHARVDPALSRLPIVPASAQPLFKLPTRALRPTALEIADNARSRSASLRVAERL